jgi:hypothetical protein
MVAAAAASTVSIDRSTQPNYHFVINVLSQSAWLVPLEKRCRFWDMTFTVCLHAAPYTGFFCIPDDVAR